MGSSLGDVAFPVRSLRCGEVFFLTTRIKPHIFFHKDKLPLVPAPPRLIVDSGPF